MPELRLQHFATRHVGPLDFSLQAGECVCIRGESGSGKSLLLRAIADLDPHTGLALLDARPSRHFPPPDWRRQVTLVMAESQWWHARVGEHFDRGCNNSWLAQLKLPEAALEWEVARCSTGERQRLALLRSLMQTPAVVLLDEPTGNLDEDSTRRVEALLATYRQEHQAALLWVSHDQRQVRRVAQRSYLLQDGQLVAESLT